jgi:hypothetical protein
MTNEAWQANGCKVVDWSMILVEFAPYGVRQSPHGGRPATLSVVCGGEGEWESSFADCIICWRRQQQDFSNASKTPHPYSVTINYHTAPQLGCCGCVCCNKCLNVELSSHPNEPLIPFPHCAKLESYCRHIKAWIVCDAVVNKGIPIPSL